MTATTAPPTSSTPVVPPLCDRTNARNVHRARPAARKKDHEPVAFAVRILLYVIYGLPLIWIVLTSLKRQGDVVSGSIFTAPSFDAYAEALANPSLLTALSQSAQIAAGTTAVVLIFGAPFAYALRRIDGRLTGLVLGLLIFLQMVPQTANIIPLFAIFSRLRLLDTTAGLIIADTAMLLPWAILLLRPFFAAVPDAIEEAASLDGAGRLRTYASVVLPIVRNGLATVGSLIFLVAWGEFLYAINLFVSPVNYPISALIAQQTSGYGIDWPGLMSLAVISSVPLLIVYVLSFRLLREGLSVGSVK